MGLLRSPKSYSVVSLNGAMMNLVSSSSAYPVSTYSVYNSLNSDRSAQYRSCCGAEVKCTYVTHVMFFLGHIPPRLTGAFDYRFRFTKATMVYSTAKNYMHETMERTAKHDCRLSGAE